MGVPALFRWLSRKYPKIISPVIEEEPIVVGDVEQPVQYSNPNPNGELDNLYLDMNGIVHPCSHPENKPPPETEAEMMVEIFRYTDRVLNMARPRKLLMIAVDGVAPRAKMNQQRSRRFRSARDAALAQEELERQIQEREMRGEEIDLAIKGKKSWDSNSITPGTPFMDILARSLRYWVAYKLANDPGWASLQVIISDATVPGEGEHKIMNFIRSQRSDPEYDPNTTHCIYGLDADLIFLGLATHEPHFKVLREDVFAKDQAQRQLKLADQVNMDEATRQRLLAADQKKPFLWLHVSILREYLEVELNIPRLSFNFDLERAIDDWVFMCFFVGNDFLPHLPSLDVRDNGIDILVDIWKRVLPSMKDYLTCDGKLNLEGVETLMSHLAQKEDEIFRKRYEGERRREENDKRRKLEREQTNAVKNQLLKTVTKGKEKAPIMPTQNMTLTSLTTGETAGGLQMTNSEIVQNISTISKANTANKNVADILKKALFNNTESNGAASAVSVVKEAEVEEQEPIDVSEKKRSASAAFNSDSEQSDAEVIDTTDSIRLWEPGYKTRYYQQKFETTDAEEIERIRKDMVRCYVEGISWALLYYFQGCPSWNWYYPYHYAPFAADFTNLSDIKVEFKQGTPFRPFEQLMSVLPAASGHNLPEVFRPLMSEPHSEIIDFYPTDFKIDMNGAKMAWQGICLLPFIDETRLLKTVREKYSELTEYEIERNTNRNEVLFLGRKNKYFDKFLKLYETKNKEETYIHARRTGLAGKVFIMDKFDPKGTLKYELDVATDQYFDISNDTYLAMEYRLPAKVTSKSMLLAGYRPHLKLLTQQDKDQIVYSSNKFYRNNRNFQPQNDIDYKPHVGPHGDTMYTMRVGGYKSFIHMYQEQAQSQAYQPPTQNNYQNQGYNNYQGQGYNNYQNQGYNNYNQGYNRGYNNYNNQNYNNQNYNNYQGYGQRQNQGQYYNEFQRRPNRGNSRW
ncbi:hypothetical protein KL942_002750 [Ogataea angusta]|uniref:5'-3' exoribonuclease n=1 Tax=Pichia angusta TaxID=870730 RepID=A0ABQ7RSR0_PICAN|nr:hypothetical protein KL942_002750 [Ogataea angusta]KAG7846610.1 hypothetical protein KL940_004208 [Ogataea angusta]